jgi:S1-C subfamily serine protease
VRRGFLGVGAYPIRLTKALEEASQQRAGALILSVQPGSGAEAAGLLQGDILLSFDGHPVGSPSQLVALLDEEKVGAQVPLKVARGKEVREVFVTLGMRE